jgi:hypothetical protein
MLENRSGEFCSWKQDLVGTPFARSVLEAIESIRVEADPQGTLVTLTIRRKMKGTAKMGALLVARGQRKELDEALNRLERRFEN